MDRATVYTSEQGRSTDFLFAQRATMIGLGKLAQAALGSGTVVRGLPVAPNSPAALNVVVGLGEIYTVAAVDATAWGALPADTTDMIVKQGLNMASQTISTPAPVTGGYSVCYLIEAQYQDQDTNAAVLPFFNSSNPQIPLNGQGGNGAPQATERQGVCVIQAKAGTPAPTGTQTTPAVDSGWTALAVVTVANGQSTVTAGNITIPAGVPQITSLVQMMQTESTNYALDTSTTPNQITIALTPPITAYTDGMQLNFRAANNSSGAVNINAGPGNIALSGAAGALQSGEIVSGGYYSAVYQSNSGTAVLVGQGAGAEQVNPATQSKHAAQLGQITSGSALTTPAQFDSSTKPATTAFVKNSGQAYSSLIGISTSTALTVANVGAFIAVTAGGTTQTLPAVASVPMGDSITIATPSGATIKGNASELINNQLLNSSNTFVMSAGDQATFVSNTGAWYLANYSSGSAASIASSGYQKLPSGLIVQWGTVLCTSANTFYTFTFPLAFPNAIYSVVVSASNGSTTALASSANTPSTSSVQVTVNNTNCNVMVMAIGK